MYIWYAHVKHFDVYTYMFTYEHLLYGEREGQGAVQGL